MNKIIITTLAMVALTGCASRNAVVEAPAPKDCKQSTDYARICITEAASGQSRALDVQIKVLPGTKGLSCDVFWMKQPVLLTPKQVVTYTDKPKPLRRDDLNINCDEVVKQG